MTDARKFTRFMSRLEKFMNRYLPDDVVFTVIIGTDDGGLGIHFSNQDTLEEITNLRALAKDLEKAIAESN